METLSRRLAAEFVGTFWLVLGGCGSAVLAAAFPGVGIGLLGVSFAFGLTVLTMAFALGPISGGHFNPAVSLGLAVADGRYFSLDTGSISVLGLAGEQPVIVKWNDTTHLVRDDDRDPSA